MFLDEIGDMDPVVQAKVLKVLEDRRFRRVGDVRDRHVDVRLDRGHPPGPGRGSSQAGAFRSDLFFRINTLTIVVPALRERVEDIPLLADHLVERIARDMGRRRAHLTPEAVVTLQEYAWPGNVRELRNVLERAVLLSRDEQIGPGDLRFAFARPAETRASEAPSTLRDVERRHIEATLRAAEGNVEQTARTARDLEELALRAPEAVRHRTVRILDPASGIRTRRRAAGPRPFARRQPQPA